MAVTSRIRDDRSDRAGQHTTAQQPAEMLTEDLRRPTKIPPRRQIEILPADNHTPRARPGDPTSDDSDMDTTLFGAPVRELSPAANESIIAGQRVYFR